MFFTISTAKDDIWRCMSGERCMVGVPYVPAHVLIVHMGKLDAKTLSSLNGVNKEWRNVTEPACTMKWREAFPDVVATVESAVKVPFTSIIKQTNVDVVKLLQLLLVGTSQHGSHDALYQAFKWRGIWRCTTCATCVVYATLKLLMQAVNVTKGLARGSEVVQWFFTVLFFNYAMDMMKHGIIDGRQINKERFITQATTSLNIIRAKSKHGSKTKAAITKSLRRVEAYAFDTMTKLD